MCCSGLQCVAVCCSVLQCVAVHYSVLQCITVCCSELCSVLQRDDTACLYKCRWHPCFLVCAHVLHVAIHCNTLHLTATHCSTQQYRVCWHATHEFCEHLWVWLKCVGALLFYNFIRKSQMCVCVYESMCACACACACTCVCVCVCVDRKSVV